MLPSDRPLKVEECDQVYVTIDFGAFDSAELLVVRKPEDLPPVDEDDPLHPFFHVTEDYFRTLELVKKDEFFCARRSQEAKAARRPQLPLTTVQVADIGERPL